MPCLCGGCPCYLLKKEFCIHLLAFRKSKEVVCRFYWKVKDRVNFSAEILEIEEMGSEPIGSRGKGNKSSRRSRRSGARARTRSGVTKNLKARKKFADVEDPDTDEYSEDDE